MWKSGRQISRRSSVGQAEPPGERLGGQRVGAVGLHDRLRLAGRAGGVDQSRDVVRPRGDRRRRPAARAASSRGATSGGAPSAASASPRRSSATTARRGAQWANRPRQLGRLVGRVDRDRDRAEQAGAEPGEQEVGVVAEQERDPVAAADAALGQAERGRPRGGQQRRPATSGRTRIAARSGRAPAAPGSSRGTGPSPDMLRRRMPAIAAKERTLAANQDRLRRPARSRRPHDVRSAGAQDRPALRAACRAS